MVLVSYTLLALHAATSLALSGENMPSAGWVLVTFQNTDDNDCNDNDTSSLKTWRVVDITCAPVICKDALGYQTPQLPSQSHSSDVLPSPSKGPPGQPYRGRGESVSPRSRTKILTTIISSPHGPAPRALLLIYCTKADVYTKSHGQ